MMSAKDYGVRVIRAYENRRVGQIFFPPALLRDALLRSRFVERVEVPEKPSIVSRAKLVLKPGARERKSA